jgi:hypothetical protein
MSFKPMFKRAHQNEETMKRLLPRWIKTRTHMKDVEWTVKNIIDTGILESTKSKHITGSPDGIGRLFANGDLGRECAAITTKGVRCGLEMKTMSTLHTAEEQNMLLGNGLEAVKYIDVMKDGLDNDPNKDFYDYVRCVEHRDQCFYHCVCLNCPYTLYVVGKPGDIIRVVILYFGEIILKWYTDVIIYQHCTFLKYFETPEAVPEEWNKMDLGWAGNGFSLRRHIALRKGWREMRAVHGLQPSPKYILPTIIVDHNMYKGGADQKTREHSNISGIWENYLTPTQRLVVHTLKHTFGQPFHLYRHAKIYEDV